MDFPRSPLSHHQHKGLRPPAPRERVRLQRRCTVLVCFALLGVGSKRLAIAAVPGLPPVKAGVTELKRRWKHLTSHGINFSCGIVAYPSSPSVQPHQ